MNSATSASSCSTIALTFCDFRPALYLLMLIVIVALAGCGESSNDVSVVGKVTYRGEPVNKGSVTFFPANGRPDSAALTDGGEFELQLVPGQYTVTVNVGTDLPPGFKEGDPVPPPSIVLPPEYTTRARSKLTATVSKDSDESINFDLK